MDIELADAVDAVREELIEAARRGAGKSVAFVVGPIDMEFTVEMRRDATAKAGFKAWVVTGDAEGKIGRSQTHKVKVTITPKRPDGRDLLIAAAPDSLPDGDATGRIGR